MASFTLRSAATFERILDGLRQTETCRSGGEWRHEAAVKVPAGPVECW